MAKTAQKGAGGFARLAQLIVYRPRVLVLGCVLLMLVGVGLAMRFDSNLLGVGYQVPGSESDKASHYIESKTGFAETDLLVVSSDSLTYDDPSFKSAFSAAITAIKKRDGETRVAGPGQPGGGEVSRDRHLVTATVAIKGNVADRQDLTKDLQDDIDDAVPDNFRAGLTGNSPVLGDLVRTEETDTLKAEGIGLPLALIVLLVAFGTVMSALLPLMMAYGGIIAAIGIVAVLMFVQDFNAFCETFLVMFGLALGIDYSLLFVRRYREERQRGGSDEEVIHRTLKTAGRTVLFSGTIFSMALIPVIPTKLPFFYDSVIAVIVVVVVEVVFLLTLMPVVLLKLGDRLDNGKLPGRLGAGRLSSESPAWHRWAQIVMRRPIPFLAAGVIVLGVAASPLLNVKTGIDLNVRAMKDKQSVKPITELEKHFPNAAVSPVEVLVRGGAQAVAAARATVQRAGLTDIQATPLAPEATLVVGEATAAIDSTAAFNQVKDLRTALHKIPDAKIQVTGVTAETVDYTHKTEDWQPWVIGAALLLSFLLLIVVFRSPVLATKAIVMNLFSIGAALGLTVLLFQEGHAQSILGFQNPGYLQSWTPLTLFIMLFGLSMDYEVFMVSRIREEYDKCGDTQQAVAVGLERTGRTVTLAAAVMIVIFGAYMVSRIPEMKQLGFGLAAAVLIDATIVRMMLVPAFMRLMGRWNWWMPAWLDRILPRLDH